MTITAKIIADSTSPDGIRLTTMQLRYPRMIHSEFMTHRVFSRNASSSRAIPVERLVQDVLDDPAMPVYWGANRAGMQAREECTAEVFRYGEHRIPGGGLTREAAWLHARDRAIEMAVVLSDAGYHKQIVNRLIEPWSHINVVVTATEWMNFYQLRRHPDAQPEIHALADAMWAARLGSFPTLLLPGEWHLPYVGQEDRHTAMFKHPSRGPLAYGELIKISVARCARVSYLTHEGKPPDVEADLALYDRLVGAVPLHASPTEHQATPDSRAPHGPMNRLGAWRYPEQHGNFSGWRQYRKMLPGESGT